jgi:cytochrome c
MEKFKGQPWTFDALNHWLYKPSAYAPGTRMSFAGITNDKQRADVIAYLRTLSDNPVPLPKPEEAKAPATTTPTPGGPGTTATQPNAPAASAKPGGAPGSGPAAGGSASAPAAPPAPAKQ